MKKILLPLFVVLFAVVCTVLASAHINDDIISYYPFDANAYDVMDQNSLEILREEQIVKEGAACGEGYLNFEKRKDVLMLIGADALGPYFDYDEMTISLWVKPSTSPDDKRNMTLLGFGSGANFDYFRFCLTDYDGLFFYFQSTDTHYIVGDPEGNNLRDGNWHHVAMTAKTGESPVFYIDGKEYICETVITKFLGDSSGYFVLGAMNGGEDNYIGGMDDLRIYGRVLDDTEIEELVKMKGTTPEAPEPKIETLPPDDDTWGDVFWDDVTETEKTPDTEKKDDTTKKQDKPEDTTKSTGKQEEKSNTGLIIGIIAGVVVVAAVVLIIVFSKKKK